MKPVVLPMLHLLRGGEDGDGRDRDIRRAIAADAEDAFEFVREHFDEARQNFAPVFQNPLGARTVGQVEMARDQVVHDLRVLRFDYWFQVDGAEIAALLGEIAALVEHVGDATAHARGKIAATCSQHEHQAFGHVLAAVIAHAFYYGSGSRISNGKALAGHAVEKCFATGSAVESDVADQNIFFGGETGFARRVHYDAAAGQAFADVVVGLALEREGDALGQKSSQTLPGRAGELNLDRVVGQAHGTITAGDLSA